MAAIYDEIDLRFSWNGDFDLGDTKDFKDTSDDGLEALTQEIHGIAASALGDWEIYPNLGAGLDDFVGEPNLRRIGDSIHDRLSLSLISSDIVQEEDLSIRVLPVHIHKLLIVVRVNAIPTPFNNLADENYLQVQLIFDFVEQGIFFLDKVPTLLGG